MQAISPAQFLRQRGRPDPSLVCCPHDARRNRFGIRFSLPPMRTPSFSNFFVQRFVLVARRVRMKLDRRSWPSEPRLRVHCIENIQNDTVYADICKFIRLNGAGEGFFGSCYHPPQTRPETAVAPPNGGVEGLICVIDAEERSNDNEHRYTSDTGKPWERSKFPQGTAIVSK